MVMKVKMRGWLSTVSLLRNSRRFPYLGKRCVVLSESGPGSEAELEHQMR